MTELFTYPMVAEITHGFERSHTALAAPMPRLRGTLAPVFWSRVRTCDLNRSPSRRLRRAYAYACEGQAPRAPRLKAPGRERVLEARPHGTKILDRAARARIIAATGEKSGLGDGLVPSRRALWARIEDGCAFLWQRIEP